MAKAQSTIVVSSVWGGNVTCEYVDSTRFEAILVAESPKQSIHSIKSVDLKYYQLSKGTLVSFFWGPSGIFFESTDDFKWMLKEGLELSPPVSKLGLYQTQLIWGKEDVERFERELPNGFEKVGENESRNFYRSSTGQVASIDKYGRSGMIYPSKEIYIHELKSMGDVPFLAVPASDSESEIENSK